MSFSAFIQQWKTQLITEIQQADDARVSLSKLDIAERSTVTPDLWYVTLSFAIDEEARHFEDKLVLIRGTITQVGTTVDRMCKEMFCGKIKRVSLTPPPSHQIIECKDN
jgi:hypothetical protein